MWEIAASFGLAVGVTNLILKEEGDKYKIKKSFRHIGYGVKDYYPDLIRTIKRDHYKEYVYNVPYGLIDDPKLQVIEKTLHKPIHIYFDGKLHIRVYKNSLPKRVDYIHNKTDPWHIPIGVSPEGEIQHSFDKIPHMTIAGMTRQGKTVLLKLIMGHLIQQHPDDAEFYIIDLKGGLEFNRYRNLQQVKTVASDVYEAQKCLRAIKTQIKRDMDYFKGKGYTNVLDTPIKRRKFIIIDEGAELTPASHHTKEEKAIYNECQEILSNIARVAGALGYRLIFGTQYPTNDSLPRQVKQNADAKISFRLPTDVASRVAIDESGAQDITNVGRAIYRTHDKKTIQVPYLSDNDLWESVWRYEDATDRKEVHPTGSYPVTFG